METKIEEDGDGDGDDSNDDEGSEEKTTTEKKSNYKLRINFLLPGDSN